MIRTGANILIAEDDLGFRDTIEDALIEEGYAVSSARNGSEALGMLGKMGRPVLIFLDLNMPVMDGVTFLRHLAEWPDRHEFQVVIMSAAVSTQWFEGMPGIVRALEKPFDIDEIVAIAEEFALTPPGTNATSAPGLRLAGGKRES